MKSVRSVWNGEDTTDSRIEGLGIAESAVSLLDEWSVHDLVLAASMPRLWLVEPNVELSVEIRSSAGEKRQFVLETTSRDLTRAGELFVIRLEKKFGRYFVIGDELWRRLSMFEIDRWCRRRELIVNLREDNQAGIGGIPAIRGSLVLVPMHFSWGKALLCHRPSLPWPKMRTEGREGSEGERSQLR